MAKRSFPFESSFSCSDNGFRGLQKGYGRLRRESIRLFISIAVLLNIDQDLHAVLRVCFALI
jgi:hypothetical protein